MTRQRRRQVNPISREEVEAKENEYNSTKHYEPIVAPTSKKYDRMKILWNEFHDHIGERALRLQKNEQPPSAGRLKYFMEWVFEGSYGILTEHMTLRTLKNTWYSFCAMYLRNTDVQIPETTTADVRCFIKTELRAKGLLQMTRQKSLADALDVAWLLTYLWCYDKHEFRHPRYRAQLSFILLLIVYTGSRPGAIVESSAYRGSNEAMRYKDFELLGLPIGPRNTLELVLKVRFRYEKNNREGQHGMNSTDNERYKWVSFREDRTCRGRCPVTQFLALAFADNVFEDIESPADLKHLKSPGSKESLSFRIKDTANTKLVFRHCRVDGFISPDLAMNYNEFARELAELGMRVGFRELLRSYNLRRGTANAIDGNSEVSQNQYAQLLGHAVKVMGAHYISNVSGIDTQGIVNQEKTRQDHIQMLRSMRLHLNLNVGTTLPFQNCMAILADPELVKHDMDIKALEDKMKAGDNSFEVYHNRELALWNRKRAHTKLYVQARRSFREGEFIAADSSKLRKMINDGKKGQQECFDNSCSKKETMNLEFVQPNLPDRYLIAKSFWTETPDPDSIPDSNLISSLQNICYQVPYILFYPGEAPVDNLCPLCKLVMSEIAPSKRPDHIHTCYKEMHIKQIQAQFLASPPTTCKWDRCSSSFSKKTVNLPVDFGDDILDAKCRQIARAKESKRLHDLKRRGKAFTCPSAASQSRKSISTHLKRHIRKGTQCLWAGCELLCTSEQDLLRHLWKHHKVTVNQAGFQPQYCFEHPMLGWFTDEVEWDDHCEAHLHSPRQNLNLRRAHHMLISVFQCPFCWKAETIPSKRFTQFTNRSIFNRHMDAHEKSFRDSETIQCPVLSCTNQIFQSFAGLRSHLFDDHDIKPTGFTRSRGFRQSQYRAIPPALKSSGAKEELSEDSQSDTEATEVFWDAEQSEAGSTDSHDWSDSDDDESLTESRKRKRTPDVEASLGKERKLSLVTPPQWRRICFW